MTQSVQVLTGTIPFGKQTGPEVVIKVLSGTRPPKPTNALSLGFSDDVWKLLEDSWPTDRGRRPPVKEVLARIKSAASACRILSPVGGVIQRYEEPDSDFTKFGMSLLWSSSAAGFIIICRSTFPWDGHR